MKRASQFDKIAQSFADKLTPEQVIALYQVVDPLTDAGRAVAAAYQRGHDIGRQTGWAEHQKYMTEMLLPHPVQ